jgi:hypothetical protein
VFSPIPYINHCFASLYVGPNDITSLTQIRLVRGITLAQITLTYRLDGVSQEFNEAFSLEFNLTQDNRNFFPDSNVTIEKFNGTIIDRDSELRVKRLSVMQLIYIIVS